MAVDLALGVTLTQDPSNTVNWLNPAHVNDGDIHSLAWVGSGSGGAYSSKLIADLGADASVTTMWADITDSGPDMLNTPESSNDGSTWTPISGSWGAKTSHSGGLMRRFTITGGPITDRYYRAGKAGSGGHGIWSWMTWEIIGTNTVALVAAFTGTPVLGAAPLNVTFADQSSGGPDGWAWDFGDSGTSTSQNPSHTYTNPGTYTVELVITRSSDSATDSTTRTEYVVVVSTLAGVFVDWDGDGFDPETSDNVTSNVRRWTISRGSGPEITGGSQPGSATVVLKNPADLYNPRYAAGDLYGKLRDGTPIWIGVNADGVSTGNDARGLFGGRVTDISLLPAGGASVSPEVEFVCEDALGWYDRTPIILDYEEGRSHDQLRGAALTAGGETRYDLAHEIHTMPLSHADGSLAAVLDAINSVNGTRHFAKPADSYPDWYTYTTRNRQWRLDATSDAALSASSDHVTDTSGWRQSADTVTNRQRATVTPIKFTPGTFTVWEADALPFSVTDVRPYTRIVDFDDVVQDAVLDIEYTGDTITSTFEPFATGGKITLTVGAGDTATVNALSVEGRLARRLEQQGYEANDTTSQAAPRGIRAGSEIGNEYLGVIASAQGIAEHVVWRFGSPQLRPTLTVVNWIPEQFELDLYDVIAFTSTQLGMSAVLFEIVGLTHTCDLAAKDADDNPVVLHTVEYVLQESKVQADPGWFVLDTSTLAAAGTDILAY